MTARRAALLACILSMFIMPACNDRFDDTSSSLWMSVGSIEPASDPFGDVFDDSTGTFMPDTVKVVLNAYFKDQNGNPTSSPYTTVQVTRYRVTFSRTDEGVEVPAGFEQALTVTIEAEGSTTVDNLTIVRADQKLQPPLVYLTPLSYGFEPDTGYTSIACNCLIEFFGHSLDGEEVYASGSIGINFANYANI